MTTTAIPSSSPEEVLPCWLEKLQASDRARGTIRRYKSAVEGFLTWYSREQQRPLTLSTLTPITLIIYRNYVQRTQHRATSTVNGQVSTLRARCAWLTEEQYLEVNPAKRLKLVGSQNASSREELDDTQANALLRQAQASRNPLRNIAIIQMLLQTGFRLDECSQLILDDIDFGEPSGRITIRQGKGNKARAVPLNTSVRQALAEYLASSLNCDPTMKIVAHSWPRCASPDGPSIPLWHSQKKESLTTSVMRQMIDVLVRNATVCKLVPASAHTLRHTFARNYLAEYPGDVVGLASLLGHTSPRYDENL